MTFHPKSQEIISNFVQVTSYACTIDSSVSSSDKVPPMEVVVVLPVATLNPGTIEIFVLKAHKEKFEQHIRSALYYSSDFESNCLTYEGPEETLGGEALCWYTLLPMYGVNSSAAHRLGIGFRLGQFIARLESLGLSESSGEAVSVLYDAYDALVERDVKLRWSKTK